jgi:hypothetical protein
MQSQFLFSILVPVTSSFLFASCMLAAMSGAGGMSGAITPIAGTTAINVSAQGMSANVDGDPGAISLGNGEFAILSAINAQPSAKLSLAKYQPSLNVAWSQQIILPDPQTSIRIINGKYRSYDQQGRSSDQPAIGVVATAQEMLLRLFSRGNRITLVSSLFGENDSIHAVVRHFDVATGRDTSSAIVHRGQLDDRLPDAARRYYVHFSPDSSKILLYMFGRNGSDQQGMVDIQTMNADFVPIATKSLPFTLSKDQMIWPSLRVDNAGKIYMITVDNRNTVMVVQHNLSTNTNKTLTKNFTDPVRSSARLKEPKAFIEPDNTLLVAFPAHDDEELAGVALVKFDFSTEKTTFTRYFSITPSLLNQKIETKEMENPHFHSLIRAESSGQYLLMFEKRGEYQNDYTSGFAQNTITTVYTQYTAGPVFALAFSSTGEPVWQSGFRKKQGFDNDQDYQLASFTPHVTHDGKLQILYHEGTRLLLREFMLTDGREATPKDGRQLMELGRPSFYMRPFTTWLHDNTVLLLCLQGLMSNNWKLYKVGY